MARAGSFSVGTTRTAFFRSRYDFSSGNDPTAASGIGTGGDGDRTKGFSVSAATGNGANVKVYVNGKLSGELIAGASRDFVTVESFGAPAGGRLELESASGTLTGTFGTID